MYTHPTLNEFLFIGTIGASLLPALLPLWRPFIIGNAFFFTMFMLVVTIGTYEVNAQGNDGDPGTLSLGIYFLLVIGLYVGSLVLRVVASLVYYVLRKMYRSTEVHSQPSRRQTYLPDQNQTVSLNETHGI